MGRSLMHAAAWLLATSAAVTLSWFGVHTVLDGTEYNSPRTLPLSDGKSPADPGSSSTQRPQEPTSSPAPSTPSESRPSKPPKSTPPTRGQGSGRPSETSQPSEPAYEGNVRGANAEGGRAVFDMREDYATLVSATPDGGWDTQVFKDSTWIRVTFSKDGASSSIFCRWDDGPPRIETYPG